VEIKCKELQILAARLPPKEAPPVNFSLNQVICLFLLGIFYVRRYYDLSFTREKGNDPWD
jgi:hypothetical protein